MGRENVQINGATSAKGNATGAVKGFQSRPRKQALRRGTRGSIRPGYVRQKAGEQATILNTSIQVISLQVSPPDGDFFLHEQQVHLVPGQTVTVAKDHLRWEQVTNLVRRGMLKITHDTETAKGISKPTAIKTIAGVVTDAKRVTDQSQSEQ